MDFSVIQEFSYLINIFLDKNELKNEVFGGFQCDGYETKLQTTNRNWQCINDLLVSEFMTSLPINDQLEGKDEFQVEKSHKIKLNLLKEIEFINLQHRHKDVYTQNMKLVENYVTSILSNQERASRTRMQNDLAQFILLKVDIEQCPLILVSLLSHLGILSFTQFLKRAKLCGKWIHLVDEVIDLISVDSENNRQVVCDFLTVLVQLSSDLPSQPEIEPMKTFSMEFLSKLLLKYTATIHNSASLTLEYRKPYEDQYFMNLFEYLSKKCHLVSRESLELIFKNALVTLLAFEPEISLVVAIQQQRQWLFTNSDARTRAIFKSLIAFLGCDEAFLTLDKVVSSLEVNWGHVLTYLGVLLIENKQSADKLKALIEDYLRRGCSGQEIELVILGFLFARHACFEGRHIFPTYSQWFGAMFGSEGSSPANTKQSFMFMFSFLSDLVPFEPSAVLKAHVHQSIHVPKGCQQIMRDYQYLAKARLSELGESVSMSTVGQFSSGLENLTLEIESAVKFFEESGKVPNQIMEASIFKRPYYISSFLPALMVPRKLSIPYDSKAKLIKTLFSLKKIPEKMYKTYLEDCQKCVSENVAMETDDIIEDTNSLQKFQALLSSFGGSLDDETESDNILESCSHLTKALEEFSKEMDEKFHNCSFLVIDIQNFDENCILNKVVTELIGKISDFWNSEEDSVNSSISFAVRQLLLLFVSSPSLQWALMSNILNFLQNSTSSNGLESAYAQKRGTSMILAEFAHVEDTFLRLKSASGSDAAPSLASDFILTQLPVDGARNLCFSACVLSSSIRWDRSKKEFLRNESQFSDRMKPLLRKYILTASRLLTMGVDGICENLIIPQRSFGHRWIPLVYSSVIPKCTLILSDMLDNCSVEMEEWLEFEMQVPWNDVPIDVRLNHLKSSFMRISSQTSVSELKPCIDDQFLTLFWALVKSGVKKKNCSEMLALLQSLSLDGVCRSICLLEEWSKCKASYSTQNMFNQLDVCYERQLMTFMSVSRCLPTAIFTGQNPIATTKLFNKVVVDLLKSEDNFFLNVLDTSFLLKCFLEALRRLSLPPNSFHVSSCFSSLRDSVLYHLKANRSLLDFDSAVVQNHTCLSSILNVNLKKTQSCSPKDIAIMLLSSDVILDDYGVFSDNQRLSIFVYVTANLGISLKWDWDGDNVIPYREEPSSKRKRLEYKGLDESLRLLKYISSCSKMRSIESNEFNDVSKLITYAKEESGPSPCFWNSFLLGVVHVLICLLKNRTDICSNASFRLSLLLVSFHNLSQVFEKCISNPETRKSDSSVITASYLAQINYEIHQVIDFIPTKIVSDISPLILVQCDEELKEKIKIKLR